MIQTVENKVIRCDVCKRVVGRVTGELMLDVVMVCPKCAKPAIDENKQDKDTLSYLSDMLGFSF